MITKQNVLPLTILTALLTFAVWIAQMVAIADGFAFWLGVPPALTYIVAFLFGWIPPFGSVIAFIAAIQVWGWSWLGAFAVFFGIYIWYGVLGIMGIFSIVDGVKWTRNYLKNRKTFTAADTPSSDIIDQD